MSNRDVEPICLQLGPLNVRLRLMRVGAPFTLYMAERWVPDVETTVMVTEAVLFGESPGGRIWAPVSCGFAAQPSEPLQIVVACSYEISFGERGEIDWSVHLMQKVSR